MSGEKVKTSRSVFHWRGQGERRKGARWEYAQRGGQTLEESEDRGEGQKQWNPSHQLHFLEVYERDCKALRKTCSNVASICGGWLVARTVLTVIT